MSSATTSKSSTSVRCWSKDAPSRCPAGRSTASARCARRSLHRRPRSRSAVPRSRDTTRPVDDKVALVLVKLGHLAVQRDREAYLRGLVDLCSQAVDAERCTVYIVNYKKKELWARVAQRTATEIRLPLGQGLAGHAALTGETVNVPDAYADARFDRNVDLRTGFRTLNMLVVPVWGSDNRTVVGVIQALNKRNGAFERRDQMLLEQIGDTVGPVLEHIPLEG
ncbi:MAG: GAF domain-containing protein [Chloroflexi bacterium]|nr:MAG: GAF domain-containing protein [Chloroflexota bacterium]TMG70632.1 MAG: GAF domain-containing protein [Chloroflexota bacterium]